MSDSTDQGDAGPTPAGPDETDPDDTGPDETDESWSISGATSAPDGREWVAVVWLDAAAGRTVVGSTPVDDEGRFEVGFESDDLVPGVAEFVLAVVDEETGRSGAEVPIASDPRETTLTEPVGAPEPLQGYAALRAALRRALAERREITDDADDDDVDLALGRATPQVVTDLADRMEVDAAIVDALRTTARTLPIGLDPAVGFVLVSAGLDLDVDALVADEDRVRTAVELAVARGEVDVEQIGAGEAEVGTYVVQLLDDLAALDDLDRPAVSGGIPIIELVEVALGDLARADLLVLAGLLSGHDLVDGEFWTTLDEADWRTADDRGALRHVFWLDELTLSSLPLIEHVADRSPALTLDAAIATSVSEWDDEIQAASTPDLSAVPDRFGTKGLQAEREAYASQIVARLRRTHPDRAGRLLVERVTAAASGEGVDNPFAALAALLASDPDFDVVRGELVGDPHAARERVLLQRVLRGDDRDPVEATFSYSADTIRPVQAVARMGQRAFAAREGSAETYRYAAFANAAVVTIYSDLRAASSAPRAEDRVELTEWRKEFGEIDDTACEHCSSVYSPAAYLVDIIRFVLDRELGDHLLDEARRPDLEAIRLDCANTETPLPYIDLVNEILESAVLTLANAEILEDDPAATDLYELPPVGQTTIDDPDELRAHPEHLAADAYDIVADAVHPFSIPFDLWHAEARAYLALGGVDRAEVRRTMRPGADTALDELALFAADLAILDGSATVRPNYQAPAYAKDADKLRRATGLDFEELADVLATEYVVGTGPTLTLDLDTEPEKIEDGLGIDHARRIHRLLLLRHRLGLDLEQLDRALGVVGGIDSRGRIGTRALDDLASLRRLAGALPLRVDEVALLFADAVSTRPRANGRSDFDDWFARSTAGDPGASSVFELDAGGTDLAVTDALVAENENELRAALAIDAADFAALRQVVDEHITLRSLADLVRWTLLARALRSNIPRMVSLVRVSEVEPFRRSTADPSRFDVAHTEAFVDIVRRLGSTRVSVDDVTDILLHPLTVVQPGANPSRAGGLAAAVRSAVAAADDDADRDEVALAAVSGALDLDPVSAGHLLDLVQPPTRDGRTAREVLLDATSDAPDRVQTLTADRLQLAAGLVRTLALPPGAVGLLFEADTGWLDPHLLPLATSDLTTETDRPEVIVSGAAVVRADADGTATIPLVVEVDGTPFNGVIEWRSVGSCAARVSPSGDAWEAEADGSGDVTIIATIDEGVAGRAPGTGAITVNVRAHDDWPRRVEHRPDRVEDDLLAVYDFHEGGGTTIGDISGRGEPLDLELSGGVSWLAGGGLLVDGTAQIRSIAPATKINDAVADSGEITVEAWISPTDVQQAGPARIVTISADAFHRNVTLGQNASGVVGRFRTSSTGENGTLPATSVGRGLEPDPDGSALHHVVYTRKSDGGRLYIDGEEVAHERRVKGSTDDWTRDMHLGLAGELDDSPDSGERAWRGTYHLVAIYDRALAPDDITRHHALGPAPALPSPEVRAEAGHAVMLPWDEPTSALDVRGSVDALVPEAVTVEWTTLSGPAPASFADPAALETTASFSVTGDYVLGLHAADRRDPNAWAEATMAIRIAADPAGVAGRWSRFASALEFSETAYASAVAVAAEPTALDDRPPGLFDLLARANAEAAQTPLSRTYIDDLGRVTGVGPQVDALVEAVIGDPESRRRRRFGECRDGSALVRVARAAAVAVRSGTAPRSLVAWAADRIDRHSATDIRVAIRSTFERDRWLEQASDVRDELRERQRDALVRHLLAHMGDFDEADDIYGHFLIDIQMSSCQLTSRLKQAISSVQQFVQRTLLGIEQAALKPEDADQWRWMKSYRVWEANRKIFLHPENWLEPELRRDKSPFFEELEADLAQVELTDAAASRAVSTYLEKLHAVANLEIVGVCHEHDGTAKTEPSVLHVIGRTRGQPRRYWHRTLVAGIDWTPWRAVDSDLMGDHIVPVFHNGRLSIFSAEFEAKEDPPANPRSTTAQSRPYASCTLAHTELFDGQWSAKVLSEGAVKLRPFDEDGRDVPFTADSRTGQLDFSPFSFHVSVDGATNDLRLEIAHRGANNMLVWPGFELPGAGTGLRALDGAPRRVRLDRRGTRDRFVGFGFGSGWESSSTAADSLAVIAAHDETGQLVPALTTGPPPPITYRAVAISRFAGGPMAAFLHLEMWFVSLSMQAMGLTPGVRTLNAPMPRIFPPPPPTIAFEFTLQGLTEAQKVQVERFFQQHRFPTVDIQPAVPGTTPRVLTLVDELTLPWSAVASARTDLAFDRAPFAVQDKLAAFLVTPAPAGTGTEPPAASLSLLTHPMVGELRRTLGYAGVEGLLSGPLPEDRRIGSLTAYTTPHVPTEPWDLLDFGVGGAFSSYHWELFVHLPLLISKRLTRDQRFDEAQRWLHFIFDPTAASKAGRDRGEPWQVKPFLRESMEAAAGELAVLLRGEATSSDERSYDEIRRDVDYLLGQIHDHPFEPHVVARLRTSAYKKAVVMAYLDNLIAWADHLFTFDTLESINEAAQLYVLAADILGERPAQKPARTPFDKTFVELDASPPTVPTIVPPPAADLVNRGAPPEEPPALTLELGFCVPANPKLLGYWDVVADRLYKVRHCQNIEGIERALALFAPPIDPGALVRAAAAGTGGGAALRGVPIRTPHYRYRVLHEHAVAAANNLRRFGGTFTNALVARDREALAELLAGQEVAMTEGTRSLLRLQRDDAQSALKALEQTRRSVEAAKDFVDGRQDETDLEAAAFGLERAGVDAKGTSAVLSMVAGFVGLVPEFTFGVSGIASPVVTATFGGDNVHKALDGVATSLATTGDALSGMGGLVANRAELERRRSAFAEDKRQAAIDLSRVIEEVEGARIRVAIASDNIATLEAQILNVRQVREQLRRRFTDEELWSWMVGRASEIFFQSYSVALDLARRAERALQIELGADDSFVSAANWDSLRKGLLSGEGLLLDLTRMNAAYLDRDRRSHELRLRVSLDELGGVEALRSAGKVELRIPERELDRRTPGHFRRRVKSVAVTVQGRNGSLDLPAKLTLLKGTTRVRPDLAEGYRRNERFDDDRFVDEFGASSIVTSGRAEDTGLFARDYDDDRYLPFEGAGLADSRWELDLFADTGADLSAVADVELVIDYSAVDGGAALRDAAVAALR